MRYGLRIYSVAIGIKNCIKFFLGSTNHIVKHVLITNFFEELLIFDLNSL